jgi:hypothetical protein
MASANQGCLWASLACMQALPPGSSVTLFNEHDLPEGFSKQGVLSMPRLCPIEHPSTGSIYLGPLDVLANRAMQPGLSIWLGRTPWCPGNISNIPFLRISCVPSLCQ